MKTLRMSDVDVYYTTTVDHEPGSGDPAYILRAARPAGAHWIVVTATRQNDMNPSFDPAWQILAQARPQEEKEK